MVDNASFWDKRADGYARSPIKDQASYQQSLARTRAHLDPSQSALEIGCGTGSTALELAPSVGQLLSTDLSGRMIEIAREKLAADPIEGLRFEQATLFDDSLESGAFDVVFAFNVVHLFDDVAAGLARANDLLKPGGLLISKTVCLGESAGFWRIALAIMKPLGLAPNVQFLKVAELEALITGAGFELVETGTFPVSPPSRFLVARKS